MHSDSVSSASSNSSSPAAEAPTSPETTMQIFVKTMKGESKPSPLTISSFKPSLTGLPAIPLTIPANATVNDLTKLITGQVPLATNMRLIHGGRHLSKPADPLTAYSVRPESTISLALPLRGGKPNLPKCDFKKNTAEQCKSAIQRIVGDCGFCGGHFCSKHRLLESHNCEGLEDCKKESHERNAEKLNTERTVAIKGI